jgi:ABC-type Fe2+-enterobactin transport system substrate-binding protein
VADDGTNGTDDGSTARAATPSTERIVDEGMLIALSAVRMAVKNRIIVSALREHTDYADADYTAMARSELHEVARQNDEDSTRVQRLGSYLSRITKSGKGREVENKRRDVIRLGRRQTLHDHVAERLRALAADDDRVAQIVHKARADALQEINDALAARLLAQRIDPRQPGYAAARTERMKAVASIDLAELAKESRSKR